MSFTVTWSQRTVGGWGGDCLGGDLTDSPPALEAWSLTTLPWTSTKQPGTCVIRDYQPSLQLSWCAHIGSLQICWFLGHLHSILDCLCRVQCRSHIQLGKPSHFQKYENMRNLSSWLTQYYSKIIFTDPYKWTQVNKITCATLDPTLHRSSQWCSAPVDRDWIFIKTVLKTEWSWRLDFLRLRRNQ